MDDRYLRKFFHFTEKDLAANRRGQFSEQQRNRLSQEARTEQASARSSATIVFVIAAAGLAIGLTIGSIAPTPLGRALIVSLMGILWPTVWVAKGVKIIRAAYALQQPRLCVVKGQAHIVRHAEGSSVLNVGEHEFDVEGNPSAAIIEGDEYTFYYLEETEEILSLEKVVK